MQRECFSNVAADITNLKSETGVRLNYTQPEVKVSVSTTTKFTEPKFQGTFKLAPGSIEVTSPVKEGPVDIKLCPDLSKFGATLAVYPLQGGHFEFGVKRECPSGSSGELKYVAADQSLTVTLRPRRVVGPATLSAEIVAHSLKTPPSVRGCAEIKDATLRCFFNPSKKQFRTAAFYKIPKVGPVCCSALGIATCFEALGAPSEVFLLGKACVKGNFTISTIGTIIKDEKVAPELEIRARYDGKAPKGCYSLGISADVKKGGAYSLTHGARAVADNGVQLAYTINNEGRFVTQLGIPESLALGAKATFTATFDKLELKKEALVPSVGVTLCINH